MLSIAFFMINVVGNGVRRNIGEDRLDHSRRHLINQRMAEIALAASSNYRGLYAPHFAFTQTIAGKNASIPLDIGSLPLFEKLMKPLSERRSTCGLRNSPLFPSNFSKSEDTHQGLIWLALRCASTTQEGTISVNGHSVQSKTYMHTDFFH